MSYVLVEFLLDKTQSVVSSDYVRNFSGEVEDDKVCQVYWAGDARTKGGFYDAKVLYIEVAVNPLQHHAGSKFLATVNSAETAEKLVVQGSLLLGNLVVPLQQVGPHTVYESVFRLSPYVPDDAFHAVLGPYRKILGVSQPTYKDHPTLYTGTSDVCTLCASIG
ncbi:hypothetical protein HPB47_027413, partial [Ixodes persulcatus]